MTNGVLSINFPGSIPPEKRVDAIAVTVNPEGMENIKSNTLDRVLLEVDEEVSTLKKSVSDGKTLLADTITAHGIETASDDSFETINENMEQVIINAESSSSGGDTDAAYDRGVSDTKKGTATTDDVITGVTFTSENGVELTGTMVDNGEFNYSEVNAQVELTPGYYSGGTIDTKTSYTSGMLAGYTNGQKDATAEIYTATLDAKENCFIDTEMTIDSISVEKEHPSVILTFMSMTNPNTFGIYSGIESDVDGIVSGNHMKKISDLIMINKDDTATVSISKDINLVISFDGTTITFNSSPVDHNTPGDIVDETEGNVTEFEGLIWGSTSEGPSITAIFLTM